MEEEKVLKEFHDLIESRSAGKIQQSITDELYKMCNTWIEYFDERYYVIGLSEDKYDFYYLCINNKERKLKFITCLYKLIPCYSVDKKWSTDEKKTINEYVQKYFNEHPKENLLYTNI